MAVTNPPKTAEVRPSGSRRDEVAMVFFGTWTATGLFIDGWAHQAQKPETFFSPWHLVLYSGFVTAVLYFAWTGRKHGLPPDHRLAGVGLALFVAGGIGDGIWHEIFGIEADIEALLSPTHLALFAGGVLMISAPIRWALADPVGRDRSLRTFAPTLGATTLVVAVSMFFTSYTSAWEIGALGTFGRPTDDFSAAAPIAAVLVTNALVLAPAMFLVRTWRTPPGTFLLLFTVVGVGIAGLTGFRLWFHVITAAVGGLAADLAARTDDPRRAIYRIGAVVPLAMWTTWLIVIAAANWVTWTIDLRLGTVTLATFAGIGLAALMAPRPEPAATPAEPSPY